MATRGGSGLGDLEVGYIADRYLMVVSINEAGLPDYCVTAELVACPGPRGPAKYYLAWRHGREGSITFAISPWIAGGVLVCTAVTDAVYVQFSAAVASRRTLWAANWSALWYLLSAFAVISYTQNATYVLFAAAGSWLGAFASMKWLRRF